MQEIVIEAGRPERHYWRDLWQYRELLRVLAWRDVAVRYKQTVIGAAWAIIRPFLTMVVFTIIFGKLANLPSDGSAPYTIMVFAGMLPWTFFSSALADTSNSVVGNANLISKVYFPRLIVPMAAVGVAFVDFAINFVMLVTLVIWYQLRTGLADRSAARVCRACAARQPGSRPLAHRVERQIPGRPLHHSVPGSVRPLCVAGRLQLEHRSGAVAPPVFLEPSSWRHRWVSLVHIGGTKPALSARIPVEHRRHGVLSVAWPSPVSKDGKRLCGSDVSRPLKLCPRPS